MPLTGLRSGCCSRWIIVDARMARCLSGFLLVLVVGLSAPTTLKAQHADDEQAVGDLTDHGIQLIQVRSGAVAKTEVTIFASGVVDRPYTGAVARILTNDPTTSAWVRFVTAAGATEWQQAKILGRPANPIRLIAIHSGDVFVSSSIEFAISGSDAQILEAGVFDNRSDDDAQSVTWDVDRTHKGQSSGKIIPPDLITREDWKASPFRGDPIPLARPSYDQITFHHAACCGAYSYEDGIEQVNWIQTFHQDGRGWSDIGYHFLLDQTGRLYQGRPFLDEDAELDDTPILVQGAHVGGHNQGNIGVSVLGCYHPAESNACVDVLSPAALDSLVTVLAFLSERYGIPPSEIMGHRDFSSTACPGDNNYRLLPDIRLMVTELLETGNAPVGIATLAATSDSEGVVTLSWQFDRDDGIVLYEIARETMSGSSVIFTHSTAEDLEIVDSDVEYAGLVRYHLRAQNSQGRWATLADALVEVVSPGGFQLSESFPNPSAVASTFRYFVAEDGVVNIALFDALGRKFRNLVDEFQQRGRWYTVRLPVPELSPGQYYYRMRVEGFTETTFDQSRGLTISR